MTKEEAPIEAVIRGVKEELNIQGQVIPTSMTTAENTINSPSYPGLPSKYIQYKFRINLLDYQFRAEGYIEVQADKKTFFIWEKIS